MKFLKNILFDYVKYTPCLHIFWGFLKLYGGGIVEYFVTHFLF